MRITVKQLSEEVEVPMLIQGKCNHVGAQIDIVAMGRGDKVEEVACLVCPKCGAYAPPDEDGHVGEFINS